MVKEFIPVNTEGKNILNEPSDFQSIGARLRFERERLKIKLIDLANHCLVTKATQINYEKNTGAPDARYLGHAHQLGLDVYFIITGSRVGTAGDPEANNLLAAYTQATPTIKKAVFAVLHSEYSREYDSFRQIPGYFSHEVIGNEDSNYKGKNNLTVQQDQKKIDE